MSTYSQYPSSNPPMRAAREDQLIAYLQIIQGVIQRMCQMSFMVKGWAMGVFLAVTLAQAQSEGLVAGAVLIFWALDSYYLALERRFRYLYNAVAAEGSRVPMFLLDLGELPKYEPKLRKVHWVRTFVSPTVAFVHLPLLVVAQWSFFTKGAGRPWWDLMLLEIERML